jgi:hypothetical protein
MERYERKNKGNPQRTPRSRSSMFPSIRGDMLFQSLPFWRLDAKGGEVSYLHPICFHLLWSEHKPLSRLFACLCSIYVELHLCWTPLMCYYLVSCVIDLLCATTLCYTIIMCYLVICYAYLISWCVHTWIKS